MKKQNKRKSENENERLELIGDDASLEDIFALSEDWLIDAANDDTIEENYDDGEEDDDYNCVMTSRQLFSERDVKTKFPDMCMTADYMGGAFIIKDNRVSYALISFDEYKSLMKRKSEHYDFVIDKILDSDEPLPSPAKLAEDDPIIIDVLESLKSLEELSTAVLQRTFCIGYGRAARIIDYLTEKELVTPPEGNKKRTVIATNTRLDELICELKG